jgi:hypothetical protein
VLVYVEFARVGMTESYNLKACAGSAHHWEMMCLCHCVVGDGPRLTASSPLALAVSLICCITYCKLGMSRAPFVATVVLATFRLLAGNCFSNVLRLGPPTRLCHKC